MVNHDDHFYGADRAMADEMACPICAWPFELALPGCRHEVEDDDN